MACIQYKSANISKSIFTTFFSHQFLLLVCHSANCGVCKTEFPLILTFIHLTYWFICLKHIIFSVDCIRLDFSSSFSVNHVSFPSEDNINSISSVPGKRICVMISEILYDEEAMTAMRVMEISHSGKTYIFWTCTLIQVQHSGSFQKHKKKTKVRSWKIPNLGWGNDQQWNKTMLWTIEQM